MWKLNMIYNYMKRELSHINIYNFLLSDLKYSIENFPEQIHHIIVNGNGNSITCKGICEYMYKIHNINILDLPIFKTLYDEFPTIIKFNCDFWFKDNENRIIFIENYLNQL